MHIRFIKNVKVELTKPDGTKQEKTFRFGECYAAISIQRYDDYVTVCLKDGDLIEGITASVFENYNVPTIDVEQPKVTRVVVKPKREVSSKQTKEILKKHNKQREHREDSNESTS